MLEPINSNTGDTSGDDADVVAFDSEGTDLADRDTGAASASTTKPDAAAFYVAHGFAAVSVCGGALSGVVKIDGELYDVAPAVRVSDSAGASVSEELPNLAPGTDASDHIDSEARSSPSSSYNKIQANMNNNMWRRLLFTDTDMIINSNSGSGSSSMSMGTRSTSTNHGPSSSDPRPFDAAAVAGARAGTLLPPRAVGADSYVLQRLAEQDNELRALINAHRDKKSKSKDRSEGLVSARTGADSGSVSGVSDDDDAADDNEADVHWCGHARGHDHSHSDDATDITADITATLDAASARSSGFSTLANTRNGNSASAAAAAATAASRHSHYQPRARVQPARRSPPGIPTATSHLRRYPWSPLAVPTAQQYVELHMYHDPARLALFSGNATLVARSGARVANIVDGLYESNELAPAIRVVLVGQTVMLDLPALLYVAPVYSNTRKRSEIGSLEFLQKFLVYSNPSSMTDKPCDSRVMLSGQYFQDQVVGLAQLDDMCTDAYSGAIAQVRRTHA